MRTRKAGFHICTLHLQSLTHRRGACASNFPRKKNDNKVLDGWWQGNMGQVAEPGGAVGSPQLLLQKGWLRLYIQMCLQVSPLSARPFPMLSKHNAQALGVGTRVLLPRRKAKWEGRSTSVQSAP